MTVNDWIGHFSLWGDFEAGVVTSKLGLSPSMVYPKGETSLSDSPALISTWDLHCPAELTASEQIDHLLTLLWPHAGPLSELTTRFSGAFNVVGDAGLCLEPTIMQKLVQLNITLNFFHHENELEDEAAVSA